MNKVLTVATTEFGNAVRTKAFIITVLFMPVLMIGSILLQVVLASRLDTETRRFAVIDHSGRLYPELERAAAEWNARPETQAGKGPRFFTERVTVDPERLDETRLELSGRVRDRSLFAFVEIPADVFAPGQGSRIRYFSNHPTYFTLPRWIGDTLNRQILEERFRAANVDGRLITALVQPVPLEELGLLERRPDGGVGQARQVDKVRSILIPAVLMFVMFMVVATSAPALLNAVIEEKMSRISEVLLGSVTPFELMAGKLLGATAVSLLLASLYVAGGTVVAWRYDQLSAFSPSLIVSFMAFLVMGVLLFGSIFVSIGAACTDLKDAQGMMAPAMVLLTLPAVTWFAIVQAPESGFAIGMSLFPFSAPFTMLLRLALQPGPPMWQTVASVVITAVTTLLLVWAAGRIFRTGILMQGKSATVREMLRWVRA